MHTPGMNTSCNTDYNKIGNIFQMFFTQVRRIRQWKLIGWQRPSWCATAGIMQKTDGIAPPVGIIAKSCSLSVKSRTKHTARSLKDWRESASIASNNMDAILERTPRLADSVMESARLRTKHRTESVIHVSRSSKLLTEKKDPLNQLTKYPLECKAHADPGISANKIPDHYSLIIKI